MDTGTRIALGVDLGGTTFGLGLLTQTGELLANTSHPTPTTGEASTILTTIAEAAMSFARERAPHAEIVGLGIGIPGPVVPDQGLIQQCPNLHALDGVNAAEKLSQSAGLPAYIGNDAFCATLAELRYGAGRDCDNLALLTLGTGVGGGIAMGNQVIRGPRQILGEVGHIIIDPDGPLCGCGNRGCLEALAGRQAIVDLAVAKLQRGRDSRLAKEANASPEGITPRLIADLAHAGDALCLKVMEQVGYYIGLAICDIIVLCDPDRVLLGGGISAAGEVLFGPVRRTVGQRSCISGFDPANILPAEMGNLAGIYGAGALVWEHQG